ncbi:protein of unknown function (plasmid) [Cupriavidus taiwanensis]|uniref:Uncharacterized protein n=1 Tax=Cupriavidus taiwanensis TaxID=164546 RepID=A0A7Z7JEA7_9BURK|nr:protein of unknown function [Cupriavidus taiwanensis]SOZ12885.1 protein of unknown function [Cupriavidus taiwanensis]SOZ41380.1 protein of unknown function [Cupriavidus taiwanensis]SPC23747.1 protein of unknown function [Cupriavidus taiwanensis]SPD54935.1 protein of unknown function [Cupriavidus taiwanensis]
MAGVARVPAPPGVAGVAEVAGVAGVARRVSPWPGMTSEADVPGARVSAPGRVVVVWAHAGTLSSAASAKIAVCLMPVSFLVSGQRRVRQRPELAPLRKPCQRRHLTRRCGRARPRCD